MDFNDIVSKLDTIIQSAPTGSSGPIGFSKRPDEYLKFECVALEEALSIAQEFPGNEALVWRNLADMMSGFNDELRALGAPEFKVIPFEVFFGMTELDAEEAI